jgi:putative endonuclease
MINKEKRFISDCNTQTNYEIGKDSERRVRIYLVMHLYKILFTRWRDGNKKGTGAGEIDIIAKRNNTIIFIEIKERKSSEDLFYSITSKQQKRIINSAILFIAKHPEYENFDIRFDAVFVFGGKSEKSKIKKITHIQNAFNASDFSDVSGF